MDYRVFDNNGELVNTVTSDEQFIKRYCEKNGYAYEAIEPIPEPEPVEPDPEGEPTDTEVLNTLLGVSE
jgi:hypothetical protein